MMIDTTITDFGKTGQGEAPTEEALKEAREAYMKMKQEKAKKETIKVKI